MVPVYPREEWLLGLWEIEGKCSSKEQEEEEERKGENKEREGSPIPVSSLLSVKFAAVKFTLCHTLVWEPEDNTTINTATQHIVAWTSLKYKQGWLKLSRIDPEPLLVLSPAILASAQALISFSSLHCLATTRFWSQNVWMHVNKNCQQLKPHWPLSGV